MRTERIPGSLVASALVALVASLLGCGAAPNHVHSGVRVVPADQVKGTCLCDDDDLVAEDAPRQRPTQYVKLRDWQPPPSVEELEASLAARGPEEPQFTKFPALTLHQPIGATTSRRLGRGNVHAR